jgi:hypothetical protein
VRFATEWITIPPKTPLPQGISLFYLAYLLVAERGSQVAAEEYLAAANISPSKGSTLPDVAQRLLATYEKIAARP